MSKTLIEGAKAPDFKGVCDGNTEIELSSLLGKKIILYFYPKDDTPGCTKESCAFAESYSEFQTMDVEIFGVSKDSIARHEKFKLKYSLPFKLISDEEGIICEAYGTWQEKKNYGRTYMGIERSTFLIDERGFINKIWRKVKVNGHVDEVIKALQ